MMKTSAPPQKTEIKIESDVWVGANVTLKKGITLHTGCVVGANSLVTHDVPPYAVVGGVPAKVIKYRFDPQLIKRLLESRWFDYDVDYLELPSNIYVYDFVKYFFEHREELPKLHTVKLHDVIEDVKKKNRSDFVAKMEAFFANGSLMVEKKDLKDGRNFLVLLETMCKKGAIGQNAGKISQMRFGNEVRQFWYRCFFRLKLMKG